ncbi:hypothetical protein NECID01_0254 [Nematocida sp. AWRm77]|nr:hypothetical protein NECID01_0254 [Nematocida sp. AWRm77]
MPEPFYMRFVRRSQEKKREKERSVQDNISAGLKESIGYEILIRMGWQNNTGLGRNKEGRVSISEMLRPAKRSKHGRGESQYAQMSQEYDRILQSRHRNSKHQN